MLRMDTTQNEGARTPQQELRLCFCQMVAANYMLQNSRGFGQPLKQLQNPERGVPPSGPPQRSQSLGQWRGAAVPLGHADLSAKWTCVWSHRSSQETEELGWNNAQPEDSGNLKVPPLVWELCLWAGLRLAAIKGPRGLLPARRLGAQPGLGASLSIARSGPRDSPLSTRRWDSEPQTFQGRDSGEDRPSMAPRPLPEFLPPA